MTKWNRGKEFSQNDCGNDSDESCAGASKYIKKFNEGNVKEDVNNGTVINQLAFLICRLCKQQL